MHALLLFVKLFSFAFLVLWEDADTHLILRYPTDGVRTCSSDDPTHVDITSSSVHLSVWPTNAVCL